MYRETTSALRNFKLFSPKVGLNECACFIKLASSLKCSLFCFSFGYKIKPQRFFFYILLDHFLHQSGRCQTIFAIC